MAIDAVALLLISFHFAKLAYTRLRRTGAYGGNVGA